MLEKKNLYYHKKEKFFPFYHYKKKGNEKLRLLFMGACTTRNTCRWIQENADKYIEASDPWENLYNPASILMELERINGSICIKKEHCLEKNGNYTDPIRTWVKGNFKEIERENRILTDKFIEYIKETDLIYINLGFTEVWGQNSVLYNRVPFEKLDSPILKNYMLSTSELKIIYQKIIDELKLINKNIDIIFSIPYPPLKISGLNKNVLVPTFKSVTSLYHSIQESFATLYYPEYEITQYYLNNSPFQLQADGRHLSAELMDLKSRQLVFDLTGISIYDVFEDYKVIKLDENGLVHGEEFIDSKRLERYLSD